MNELSQTSQLLFQINSANQLLNAMDCFIQESPLGSTAKIVIRLSEQTTASAEKSYQNIEQLLCQN